MTTLHVPQIISFTSSRSFKFCRLIRIQVVEIFDHYTALKHETGHIFVKIERIVFLMNFMTS